MVRVMQINLGEAYGGVSSMIFNLYSEMNHNKVQFDFVAPKSTSFKSKICEIQSMGGRIIELKTSGNIIKRKLQFFIRLVKLMKSQNYKIVHINSGSTLFNIQVAWIAKLCGIRTIIVHSHNAGNDSGIKKVLMKVSKPLLEFGPTNYFACSNKAAKYMFTNRRYMEKKYKLIKNAVDIDKFEFSEKNRDIYREKYKLKNKIVLLHVGRFSNQKNHKFLISIFKNVSKMNPNARLVLVGVGELQDSIKEQVREMDISSKVLFLNLRDDINNLMSMSDVLVMPSLYEGLPVVGVEAQASGLNCIFSNSITSEVDLTDQNEFLSLNSDINLWTNRILTKAKYHMSVTDRLDKSTLVKNEGYSISDVAKKLENFYLSV